MSGQGRKQCLSRNSNMTYRTRKSIGVPLEPIKAQGPADWPTRGCIGDLIGIDNLVGHASHPRLAEAAGFFSGHLGAEGHKTQGTLDPDYVYSSFLMSHTKNGRRTFEGQRWPRVGGLFPATDIAGIMGCSAMVAKLRITRPPAVSD